MKGHFSVRQGKRVLVLYKDGRKEIDRFLKAEDRYVYLRRLGRVPISELRTLSIYRDEARRGEVRQGKGSHGADR